MRTYSLILCAAILSVTRGDQLLSVSKDRPGKVFTGIGPILSQGSLDWSLVYLEDFETERLDLSTFEVAEGNGCKTIICGYGNGEIQNYTANAVKVSDGRLSITATKKRDITQAERSHNKEYWLRNEDDYVTTWESGRISTVHLVQGRYGLVTISARLPIGRGVFPALWMRKDFELL